MFDGARSLRNRAAIDFGNRFVVFGSLASVEGCDSVQRMRDLLILMAHTGA